MNKAKDKLSYLMMENNNFQKFKLKYHLKVLFKLRLVISQKIQVFFKDPLKRKKLIKLMRNFNNHKNIFKEKEIYIAENMRFLYSILKYQINQSY